MPRKNPRPEATKLKREKKKREAAVKAASRRRAPVPAGAGPAQGMQLAAFAALLLGSGKH